ncbi:MAG: glutamine-hydrolyzing carbamoyl-phosphate synthase small subunit [Candidatus Atabeyarchaeum deiterrae]
MEKSGNQGRRNAALVLEDGTVFQGFAFGASRKVGGEVVFNTAMYGYNEALTDPSYWGQILVYTYPLVGNYGVPQLKEVDSWNLPKWFESDSIKVRALVVHEVCKSPSHWSSSTSLDGWLRSEGIPGIYGIDTRALTKRLRVHGVMLGMVEVFEEDEEADISRLLKDVCSIDDPNKRDLVAQVSVKEPVIYGESDEKDKPTVVLIDCGAKKSILRELLERNLKVVRVPPSTGEDEILEYGPQGFVVSNGPGDPKVCVRTIETVSKLLADRLPMFSVCLGNQIFALSLGGSTYKLKFGHRSVNSPIIDLHSGRCYISSANHGFAVDANSLEKTGLSVSFLNANDRTVEGIRHESMKAMSIQHHPEHSPGPSELEFLFDVFAGWVRKAG